MRQVGRKEAQPNEEMTSACGRQPLGKKTAEPSGQNDAEKSYAEGIDGMAKKY